MTNSSLDPKDLVEILLKIHAAHVGHVDTCPWCAKARLEDIIDDEGLGTSMGLWNAWKDRANNGFKHDHTYPDVLRTLNPVDPRLMELVMQADSE